MRKLLLVTLVWFMLAGLSEAGAVQFVNLTIEANPASARTVSWRSSEYIDAVVDYRDRFGKIYHCQPSVESYIIEEAEIWFYTARLADLLPGQPYDYQIKDSGGTVLAAGNFKTAEPEQPVKFLLFGDSQSIDYGVWRRTLLEAAEYHGSGADFLVNNGDLVDNGSQYSEWQKWFQNAESVLPNLTVVPVVGNHETFAADYRLTHGFSKPELFVRQFALPQNGLDGLKEQVYSFDYGMAHIVVLDTQFAEQRNFLPDAWQRQLTWLAEDLAASSKRWKIVFMHKPVYHNRADSSQPDLRFGDLEKILQQGGVSVVFTAHDHVLARTVAANGIVYLASGRSGTKSYQTKEAKYWNEWFYNPAAEPVYMVVNIEGTEITAETYGWNNKRLDSWQFSGR